MNQLTTRLARPLSFLVILVVSFVDPCSAALVPQPKPIPGIVRGPYLQSGTTNSMVIRWRTDILGPSVVRYGRSPDELRQRATSAGQLTEHVVLLTNLAPNTKYYYAFGTNDVPMLVSLSNNVLSARTTNGPLWLGTTERTQLGKLTNGAFVVRARRNGLVVSNSVAGWQTNTSHRSLVLSTTNYNLLVTLSDRALRVQTTNFTREISEVKSRSGKTVAREFVITTTNAIRFAGEDAWFMTPPETGSREPTRIWVVGDPGTRRAPQYHVRDAFLNYNKDRRVDVWLLLGDNAYTAGTDVEYQGSIFNAYPNQLRNWVLWPSLGNHDAGSANSRTQSGVYYDIFTLPTLGQTGGEMSGTEAYYSFDYANVHFIAIDSANSDLSTNGPMYHWLKKDLAANKQDWCIAFCHHPPYTKGSHDSDRERDSGGIMRDMRAVITPLLEEGGVDVLLTGHSHAYERSYLLDSLYTRSTVLDDEKHVKGDSDGRVDSWGAYHKPSRGPAPHEGTLYIVAGSSGQVSGGGLLHPAMYAGLNVHGSLVLDVHGHKLEGMFIDTNSLVRDYFTVAKGAEFASRPTDDETVEIAGEKVPARLKPVLEPNAPLLTVTNARPWDEEVLMKLYASAEVLDKTALTWALASVGDAEAVVTLMGFLTNKVGKTAVSQAQDDLRIETVEALGFLATRYEAPFLFLKKGTDPEYWKDRKFWISPRGTEGSRLLALACVRALGLSGRPEARLELLALHKKHEEEKRDSAISGRLAKAAEEALRNYQTFQRLGPVAFQRQFLQGSTFSTQTSSLRH
jgi:hypothetical protein